MTPIDPTSHLTPSLWAQANRQLVRKALAEFAHERLLAPRRRTDGTYVVLSDDTTVEYSFAARTRGLEHWQVDAASVVKRKNGVELPLDAMEFFVELRESLGLTGDVLPVYLEEIAATLSSLAYKLATKRDQVKDLIHADFQHVEASMTEGHPCFVANSGRLGFDVAEFRSYAPEAGEPVRLLWIAAHRDRATFTPGDGIDYDTLMLAELGEDTLAGFAKTMADRGLDLADYRLMPVHPWQWWNKLAVTFASEVARQSIVYLGPSDDGYQAQQSIRTFFNTSNPDRHYVKTSLSVLNMGFMRGLSAAYMEGTPAINDWLADLVAADEVLTRVGFRILRERATVGYRHREFEAATVKGSPYRKMLAALWRESPVPDLAPDERAVTMASLLHVDADGDSFVAALVRESGLPAVQWLRRYLDAYLVPLLHCFYAYELAYMPHGENVVLVLDDHGVVRRVFFKDIAEEVVVTDPDLELPPEVERIRADVPEDMRLLTIFTDVFDCYFRFLAAIMAESGTLYEDAFWATVAACVVDYQESTPQLTEKFARFDIFAETFARSCLNRLQLANNEQMVDLEDPAGALQLVGTLDNPLAKHARGAPE